MEAWKKAEEEGMDLVLVSSEGAVPPVVRIQDYNKLQYEKKKKQKQAKHKTELKEIQLKANISDHDLQTKVTRIDKFLERGDKVKITVRLKGRERDNPQRAFDLMNRAIESVSVAHKANRLPGPIAAAILEPVSSK
jgi:translation initiation factor IF-3